MDNKYLSYVSFIVCLLLSINSLCSQNHEVPSIPEPTIPLDLCKERILSQCDTLAYKQLSCYDDFLEPETFCYKIFMANHCGVDRAFMDIMMAIANIISDVDFRTRIFCEPYVSYSINKDSWIIRALKKQNPTFLQLDSAKAYHIPSQEPFVFTTIRDSKSCIIKRGSIPAYKELKTRYRNSFSFCEMLYYAIIMSGVYGYEPAAYDVYDIMCELFDNNTNDIAVDSISMSQMTLFKSPQ